MRKQRKMMGLLVWLAMSGAGAGGPAGAPPVEAFLEGPAKPTSTGASNVEHSDIFNQASTSTRTSVDVGVRGSANMSAVKVEKSEIKGTIFNEGVNMSSTNMAVGIGSSANAGAVEIR